MASRRVSKSLRCVRRRRRARTPRDGEEPLEDGEEPLEDGEEEAEDCEEDAEDGDTAVGDTAEVGDTASCGGDDGGVDAQRCGQGRRGGTSSRGSSMLKSRRYLARKHKLTALSPVTIRYSKT